MTFRLLPPALLLLLALATPANAATVTVGPNDLINDFIPDGVRDGLQITALPGEANDVTVTYPEDPAAVGFPKQVIVRDAGAPLTAANPECAQTDAHTVTCARETGYGVTRADVGDGDDAVRLEASLTYAIAGLDANGGSGTDRLIGAPTLDRLNGGGGKHDVLRANGSQDELADGDTDARADADTIDGGTEGILRYDNRTRPVVLRVGGAPVGEGDRVTGVSEVHGGSGDDRISVGDTPTTNVDIHGAAGDDRLSLSSGYQRRGLVYLRGDTGRDRLFGRRGRQGFVPGPGRDEITCGPGSDFVTQPGERDVMRDCEEGELFTETGDVEFDPSPARAGSRLRFRVSCLVQDPGNDEIEPFDTTCSGRLTLKVRGRTVGTGRLSPGKRTGTKPVTVRPTRATGGRPVRVSVRYKDGTTVRWAYRP